MPDYDVGIERKKSVSSESAPVGKGSGLTSAGLERDDCTDNTVSSTSSLQVISTWFFLTLTLCKKQPWHP